MRWVRTLLFIVVGLVALIVLVLLLAPSVLNLEQIKEQVVQRVEQQLNRNVELGRVRLEFLSGLGAGLEQLTIANPDGWQSPHFVKVDTLSVKVALRPLLSRRIEVSKIILHSGDIVIERDAQGQFNYSDLTAASADTPSSKSAPPPAGASPLASLLVSKLALDDVDIHFIDRMVVAGQTVTSTLRQVQVEADNIGADTPITFDLSSAVLTDGAPNLRMRGTLGPVPDLGNLDVQRVPLQLALNITDLPVAPVVPYLGESPALTAGVLGTDLTVQGTLADALHIKGQLTLRDATMPDATGQGAPTALPNLALHPNLALKLDQAHLAVTDTRIDLGFLQATLQGTIASFTTTPQLDLRVDTAHFDPAKVMSQLPMLASALPQPAALQGDLKLQATIRGTPTHLNADAQVTAQSLSLKSGSFHGGQADRGGMHVDLAQMQTQLKAQLQPDSPPAVDIDVSAAQLIFDQQSATAPEPSTGRTPPPPSEPATGLQAPPVKVRGQIALASGRLTNIAFQNFKATFSIINGQVKSQHTVQLFDGDYQGSLTANLAQPKPTYQITLKLANIQAGEVANTFTATPNILFGRLHTDLNFSGQGLDWSAISTTLTGKGKLNLSDFKLTTLDIMPKLAKSLAAVSTVAGFTVPDDLATRSFDELKATLRLQNGKLHSDDLTLWGPDVQLLGQGMLGLDRSLAFDGTAMLLGKLAQSLGKRAQFLLDAEGRINIPLAIEGTVTQPRIALNERHLTDLAQRALTQKVKDKAGKEVKKLIDQVLPGAGEKKKTGGEAEPLKEINKTLKGLFNR